MKLDISIVVPGMAFNGETFHKQSLGGSESAAYYMARALGKLGHNVQVFCNTPEPVFCKEANYLPLGMFQQYAEFTAHDVCIVQRAPEYMTMNIRAKYTVLWCHDLASKRSQQGVVGTAFNYDKLFVLSDFMRRQYMQVYGIEEKDNLLFQTRNGVDLDLIETVRQNKPKDVTRNPLSIMYSARPERGLDVMLMEIMPRILKEEPNAKLFLSTYNNPAHHLENFYAACKAAAERLNEGKPEGQGPVVFIGHLNKESLYQAYHQAGIYAYPMPSRLLPNFDEVSCISVMEAQACGLPVVTTARGALPETLAPNAGTLISEPIHTPEYYDAFAAACIKYMRDSKAHKSASEAGVERAKQLGWDAVAEQWTELFIKGIEAKASDYATLANHFWRRSDIYAARACLSRLPLDDAKSAYVRERVTKDWAFLDEPEGFRKQYEKIGATHDERVIDWSPNEPRFHVLRDFLRSRPELDTILDYGCAHGGYATNLLAQLPHLKNITGVDIDLHGIQLANSFAEKLGVQNRFIGVVGNFDRLQDPALGLPKYKMAMAQEVLEHVPDPAAVLAELEKHVEDGGLIYFTVPFGPWEYTDYKRYPYRAHIWEFDLHDLHDLLDVKGWREIELQTHTMPYGRSPETNDALGWWIVQYKVTPESRGKFGKINWDRKLKLQAPRQTVSVCIMAGGPNVEDTLVWNLKSLETVADEVIVVDCGMSPWAKEILRTSNVNDGRLKVVEGPNPTQAGFETPRNIALEHATQDWILWIDCDEKLLQPEQLHRYLRANSLQGYSIRQHHFAVDTTWAPDLPVRLFRNNGKMRFYGMIHEHPETGLNEGPGRTLVIPDVHIPHLGYLIESGRKVRFNRNLPMLEADKAKYPERKLQKQFIMRDNILMVSNELRHNGGVVTERHIELCREVRDLWREHFRAKGFYTHSDPIVQYSEANKILASMEDGGFDMAVMLSADKVDAKEGNTMKIRFANLEDAQLEVAHRVKQLAEVFEEKYY